MPEGDTIHAVARSLQPELVGHSLRLLEVHQQRVPWGDGAYVTECEARGKHLYIMFMIGDARRFVRVHLGMKGSWHRYRPDERWQRNPLDRHLVLATERWVFVCFGPKEVEVGLSPGVSHLGPDLLAGAFDLERVIANTRRAPTIIGELLLDQTVASGIGNVYKSETLFIERVDPWIATAQLDDATLRRIYERARQLMRSNLERGGLRTTIDVRPISGSTRRSEAAPGQRYWVYRRAARPCLSCDTIIMSRLQGDSARMTYWCSHCQSSKTAR